MERRKTEELVNIKGRQFIIKLFPAAESLAILKELMTRALPIDLLSGFAIGGKSVGDTLSDFGFGSQKNSMSIDEFANFEKRLLTCVYARLKDGDEPILDDRGNFQVVDIEYNLSLMVDLLLKVVSVNYKDFFLDKLKEIGLIKEGQEAKELKELVKNFVE